METSYLRQVFTFTFLLVCAPTIRAQQPEPVSNWYQPQEFESESESIGNIWRIGAQITHGSFDIFTTFDDDSESPVVEDDWMGLALSLPFSAGMLTSNHFEVGFNGLVGGWLGNQDMVDSPPNSELDGQVSFSGSTLGFAIEALDIHARFYANSIQEPGFSPWGQISTRVIEHFRLGTGLDDPLHAGVIDTSIVQLDFVDDFSFDVSLGASYRFAEAASFDLEIPILKCFEGDDSITMMLFNYDTKILFGFSVWL